MLEFKQVTKEICKLPSFFSTVLFRKIDVDCRGVVTRYAIFLTKILISESGLFYIFDELTSCIVMIKFFNIVTFNHLKSMDMSHMTAYGYFKHDIYEKKIKTRIWRGVCHKINYYIYICKC